MKWSHSCCLCCFFAQNVFIERFVEAVGVQCATAQDTQDTRKVLCTNYAQTTQDAILKHIKPRTQTHEPQISNANTHTHRTRTYTRKATRKHTRTHPQQHATHAQTANAAQQANAEAAQPIRTQTVMQRKLAKQQTHRKQTYNFNNESLEQCC